MALIIACGCDPKNDYQENQTWFINLLTESVKNGSSESLISNLNRLNESGGTVSLFPAGNRLEAGVQWCSGKAVEKPYMYGGLIYHPSDNSWSVHT